MFSMNQANDNSVAHPSTFYRARVVASFDEISQLREKRLNQLASLLRSAMKTPTPVEFICKAN